MSQEQDIREKWKHNFNFAFGLFQVHQRGIILPFRNRWGAQALGLPCLFALILMVVWASFTQDPFMLIWIGIWLLFLIRRRVESVKLADQVHSQYDGCPINLGRNERLAKMFFEPALVGVLGYMVFLFYQMQGWRPNGLPYFLLAGTVTLPFVAGVHQAIWQRKVQGLMDAKNEQESLADEFHNRVGR